MHRLARLTRAFKVPKYNLSLKSHTFDNGAPVEKSGTVCAVACLYFAGKRPVLNAMWLGE